MSEVQLNMPSQHAKLTGQHGRTDVRTKMELTSANHLQSVTRAGGHDEIATIGEVMRSWPKHGRHPVVRTGERQSIPPHVRAAVWYRDHGKCELCGTHVRGVWHLDHITPWSAGGPDTTDNLRVLCEQHNISRGNSIDPTERPRRPATWWCQHCYSRDGFAWEYDRGVPVACPTHKHLSLTKTGRCRALNGYIRNRSLTGEWPDWHEREPLTELHVVAYCAHCDAPGLTGVVL